MTLTIRNASPADRDSCMALLESLASFTGGSADPLAPTIFDQLLETTRGEVFVAEEEGSILGMASVSYNLAMIWRRVLSTRRTDRRSFRSRQKYRQPIGGENRRAS